ncbi:hypothetical protein Y032_0363g3543 [Ancylostoma ceylanicum]|nr:hypothetical protein Y032_0363g3543 [Ancylostoma ceylanicum]
MKGKSKACQEHRKVVRRLKVIVIVFVFSWFMAMLGVDLGNAMGFSADVLSIWQSNMVLFALLCYSQTFYVCIWRSPEYRSAFVEQLYLATCRKPSPNFQPQTISTINPTKILIRVSRQCK